MSIGHVRSLGTNMVNPIQRPSGDQPMSPTGSVARVICDVAPSASM
jgi:hypothetical protein